MAEAFAAVASGAGLVSLALQLADCAVKLKSFCDHVEKAPKKLRRIAGEIETLSLVLHQIEALRVQHGISNSDVLARCIQQCQASTHEIVTSTGAMEIMLRKYKAPGRIVVALKLPELNGLCNDLERAKSNLLLAFQMFQAGLQGSLMATMLALSNQITTLSHLHQPLLPQHACPATLGGPPLVQDTADTSQPEPMPIYKRANPNATNDHRRKYPTPQRRWQLRVRLPLGFSQTVWDISIRQSFRGWEACLQCVNIVPYDSPVFHYVARNDVVIVEKLFREGKASPYDSRVTDYGVGSLLSTSDWVSAEMYAVILSHMRPRDRNSAVETMLQEQHWVQDFEEAKGLSYLVESQDVDMADLGIMTLGLPSLPVVKQNMSNFGYYWDGHVWFDWFTELNYGPLGCTLVAQEFTKYCSDGQGVSGLLPLRSHRRGESVLHYTARRVGQLASYDIQDQESIAGWVQLFSSVMETAGGSALLYDVTHARATEDKISPFMAFLEALYSGGDAPLQQTLSIWQMLLESIGVLADEFLEKEMLLWESLCHRQALRSIFHEIELVGLYQEQSIKAWRGRYVVPIVLYSLPSPAPGSWPVSPYVPRCICWLPRLHHAESVGEDWSEDGVKCMIQLSDSWPLETPSELGGPGRVWRWAPHRWRKAGPWSWEDRIYSDDDDASRILQPRKSSLRRIHSEPSSLVQAYNRRSRLFAGALRYCQTHTRWKLRHGLLDWSPDRGIHVDCHDERCCEQTPRYTPARATGFDMFSFFVVKWRKATKEHGVWPAECGEEFRGRVPWTIADQVHLDYPTVTCDDVLSFAVGSRSRPGCEQFPDCCHQEIYLAALRRRKEDEERGIEVELDRSWWPFWWT